MKIKYSLLCKLVGLTNKEVVFLLYIARFQNEKGEAIGIYYKDIMKECDMCKQTFYTVLRSLEKKGLIAYTRVDNDYNITILNNDFSYPGSYSEGYVNVGRKVFGQKRFRSLRAKEKVLTLLFLKITHENSRSYRIEVKEFYKKYKELLGVTERVLRGYLHSLRKLFSIGIKDRHFYITYRAEVFKDRREESETDQYLGHIVRTGCRRNKVNVSSITAVKDTLQLIKQYRQEAREAGRSIFEILNSSLAECRNSILNSKYIHKLIRQALGIEHRPTMGVQF